MSELDATGETSSSADVDARLVTALSGRFRTVLTRYFQRRRLSTEDAEDAVQDVFFRLSRRQGLAELRNVDGYLFETAASVAVDHHRRASVRHRGDHEPFDEGAHAGVDLAPDRILEGREELALVLGTLRRMPERTRHVFVLAKLEHLHHREIAQRLGISVSSVEKHLVKALARLVEGMGGQA